MVEVQVLERNEVAVSDILQPHRQDFCTHAIDQHIEWLVVQYLIY